MFLILEFKFKSWPEPDIIEYLELLKACADIDIGCIQYDIYLKDNGLVILEQWESYFHYEHHKKQIHYTEFTALALQYKAYISDTVLVRHI